MTNGSIESGAVQVRILHTGNASPGQLASWTAVLDAGERARADRFRSAEDRRDYIAAHSLLRTTLSRGSEVAPMDWRFVADGHGKPALVADQRGTPPLAFNLSHTRDLVACAVTRGAAVGVDVERTDRNSDVEQLAARFFSPAEAERVRRSAAEHRSSAFAELWVLKEAFLKADGKGLAAGLDQTAFSFDGPSDVALAPPRPGWSFFLARVFATGRFAIACRREDGTVLRPTLVIQGPLAASDIVPLRWTQGLRWHCLPEPLA